MLLSQSWLGLPSAGKPPSWAGWMTVLLLGSLVGCSAAPDAMETNAPDHSQAQAGTIEQLGVESLGTVETYQGEDGTHFVADPEGCGALPRSFPDYLLMPGSQVLSSGVIGDEQGSLMSVRLRTLADAEAVAKHYRDDLWYRRWDLLSESDQGGFIVWVLEDTHPDPARYGRQVMIQVSPEREAQREILIMLSQMESQDQQTQDQQLTGMAPCQAALSPG